MNLKEMGVNARNLIISAQNRDCWSISEYGIEPPVSINH